MNSNQPTAAPSARASRSIALLVAGCFFMENLDGTVIATALPAMARSFGSDAADLNIGMSAYLVTLGVFIPISGWIADRFGARRVFAGAIMVFTLASALCGISASLGQFVAVRIVQGIGGAMMVPVGRLVVLRATPKNQLVSAIATLTWPALVAPILGPAIGGVLTDHLSWRWIFYLNVPLGIAALLLALRLLPAAEPKEVAPLDWPGFLASGGGLLLLMGGLELFGRMPLPTGLIALLIGGSLCLLFYAVRHFRHARHPLLDLSVLRVPTFAVTIWGGSLFRMSIGAVPFLLPLLFQLGFGYSAFQAGLMLIAVFAGNLAMKPATTAILRRFGFRRVLVVNGLVNALALGSCALLARETPMVLTVLLLFVGGMSRSMQFTALNTIAFADIPDERMNPANTLFTTAMQLTMGMGVAVGAIGLRIAEAFTKGAMPGSPYSLAFFVVALVAIAAIFDAVRLDRDAGAGLLRARSD